MIYSDDIINNAAGNGREEQTTAGSERAMNGRQVDKQLSRAELSRAKSLLLLLLLLLFVTTEAVKMIIMPIELSDDDDDDNDGNDNNLTLMTPQRPQTPASQVLMTQM
ncbi:unnamed protein product [Gongylonema pulchrum]|uniref:Uncharacterized protein n=1 Tax=Gongylonema pulchrum TaxID=637853 RepID=A0A183E4G1_9BILA|nr:unnamed protein product [Gongylonema pulchrum]